MTKLVLSDGFNISKIDIEKFNINGVEKIHITNYPYKRTVYISIFFSKKNINEQIIAECLEKIGNVQSFNKEGLKHLLLEVNMYIRNSNEFENFVEGVLGKLESCIKLNIVDEVQNKESNNHDNAKTEVENVESKKTKKRKGRRKKKDT